MEPIVAYRVWVLQDKKLHSTFIRQYEWEPGVPAFQKLGTGIHAFKNLEDVLKYTNSAISATCAYDNQFDDLIYGEVYLWGKITEHRLGYRAEFAYPKSLWVPEELHHENYSQGIYRSQVIRELRNIYGCEVSIFPYKLDENISINFGVSPPPINHEFNKQEPLKWFDRLVMIIGLSMIEFGPIFGAWVKHLVK